MLFCTCSMAKRYRGPDARIQGGLQTNTQEVRGQEKEQSRSQRGERREGGLMPRGLQGEPLPEQERVPANRDRAGQEHPSFQDRDSNLIYDTGGVELRQVGYERQTQQPMQPAERGGTPPPPPPITPSPAQIAFEQGAQGNLTSEQAAHAQRQAAEEARNRYCNSTNPRYQFGHVMWSGQPTQRGGTAPQHFGGPNDPWQGGQDPWQGGHGQKGAPIQNQHPSWHTPQPSHTRTAGGSSRDFHTEYPPAQQEQRARREWPGEY